jgi:hypothetical protein
MSTSQNQTKLNNIPGDPKAPDVTIEVSIADNFLSIYLNPDTSGPGLVKGFVKVYESLVADFESGVTASIDITNYLKGFKALNPTVSSVVLAFCLSNFAGSGPYAYSISGQGIKLLPQSGNLAAWTSQMDSYIINI